MDSRSATGAFGCGIALLFWLDRDREARTSSALWLAVAWFFFCSSRTFAQWLGIYPLTETSEALVAGSPVDAATYFALLVASVVVLAGRRERVAMFLRANGPLLLFLLYCGISVLWSDFPFVALKRWTKALGDVSSILIVLTDGEPIVALKRLLARAGFVLVPVSILLIRYYPTLGRDYSDWTGAAYNMGVATGKNGLGYVCLVFGLASVWRLNEALRGEEDTHKFGSLAAHSILLVLVLWLFQMAQSATSFFCFLMGSALIVIAGHRAIARQRVIVHMLVAVMLFVVVYGLLLNPGTGLAEMAGRDSSLTGRTRLWNQVLRLTVDPLFGAGYESFWLGDRLEYMWSINWEHPNQAHNGYLEIFLDLGWAGVALLGVLMICGYRNIARALRWDLESAKLRLAFFVVAASYNLTEHAFRELHPVWIGFLLAIIAVPEPLARETEEATPSLEQSPHGPDWSIAASAMHEVDV
jgi:O-antigen ligase